MVQIVFFIKTIWVQDGQDPFYLLLNYFLLLNVFAFHSFMPCIRLRYIALHFLLLSHASTCSLTQQAKPSI